jgi:hypothetical protein
VQAQADAKKPYTPPTLERYGTIREVNRANATGTKNDKGSGATTRT